MIFRILLLFNFKKTGLTLGTHKSSVHDDGRRPHLVLLFFYLFRYKKGLFTPSHRRGRRR